MYDVAFIRRECRNLSVNKSTENMSTHAFLSFSFFIYGFIQIRFCSSKIFLFLFYEQEILFIKVNAIKFLLSENIFSL